MTKEAVIQHIIEYLQNDKANYAVMLCGEWGSGKTHLYKNHIRKAIRSVEFGKNKESRKTEIYISLYGVSSIEDLTKEIILNFVLKTKLNENEAKGKLYTNTKKLVGIVSKMVSFSVENFSFDFGNISEVIEENIDYKNMVICFDDLERCSIPINNLFGVINNLVEHCNCKVIIIADEDNIGKMYANTNVENKYMSILNGRKVKLDSNDDKTQLYAKQKDKNEIFEDITIKDLKALNEKLYSENFIYKDIKEKVIGMSLRYDLDFEEEYDDVVEDVISKKALKEFLKEQKEEILACMDKCDNRNIRIMKTWLINYERIYGIVKKHYENDKEYIEEINKKFMLYSIRIACAVGKNKELSKWDKESKVCYNVSLDDGFLWGAEGYWFIDKLFLTSTLDEKDVCEAAKFIINRKKEEEEQKKKYSSGKCFDQLSSWKYLEDEEVAALIEELIKEIKEKKYIYQAYQTIISLLVTFQDIGLYRGDVAEVTEIMIDNIKADEKEIFVERMNIGFENNKQKEMFDKYYKPINTLIMEKNQKISESKIEDIILPDDENWAKKFDEYCQNKSMEFYGEHKFLQYINIDLLFDKLKTAKTREVHFIKSGIRYVYRYGNINEYFKGDISKLTDLTKKIEEHEWVGITKKRAIEELKLSLQDKLKDLEKPLY